jgi:DNA polymerase I
MSETLYLIDGYAQIFRAYYAIRGGMHSPVTSEPTHAVYGFTGMLLKLLAQFQPHYVVVAIDAPGRTFRDDLYTLYPELRRSGGEPLSLSMPALERMMAAEGVPGEVGPVSVPEDGRYAHYKGTRRATPEDLTSQIDRIFEVIESFGVPIIGQPGLEADDVIASITHQILSTPEYRDVDIRIVSKDKDLEQLINDRVTLFDIHTDTTIDTAALHANKGITPQQVIDVLALTGDTVDNVPGVEGIGLKTAAQLINQYGSLEGIYEHLDQIKGKRRENLEKARGYLPLSRAMVTLIRNANLPFSLGAARVQPINLQRLLPIFRELGFNRYQEEARQLAATSAPLALAATVVELTPDAIAATETVADGTVSPFSPASFALPAISAAERDYETAASGHYEAITTREQLDALVATLAEQTIVSVDTETTGLERDARLCGLSFAWRAGHGVYVPTLSPHPDQHLDAATVLDALRPLLEDADLPKCGHNLKFDARVLLGAGVHLRGVAFDSLLASILLDPAQSGHKLDNLALTHLDYRMIPISDLIGGNETQSESQPETRASSAQSIDQVDLERVTVYAAEDADIALRLYHALSVALEDRQMAGLLRDIEAPLICVLAELEGNGILCDPEELRRQGQALGTRVEELRQEIYAAVGSTFQIESTQQLAVVLFDQLGFAAAKKTKTGRSTDITVLEKLAAQEDRNDPRTGVPRLVIEYRQLTKLISTYLGNLIASIHPEDGRIHTTYHQLVTATGRLASHNPNLQNIPVRGDIGRQIRKAFHAPPGCRLICADYSQVELRLLAHLSEDPALLTAFESDQDVHAAIAAQVFHVPLEQVTKEQRARAKTINFGIIYGITPAGLARRIKGMDVRTATELIAEYRLRFPGIERFLQRCVQEALEEGYVCTLSGRRRAIPEIRSANRGERNLGERLAINSVVQGSAADLIKAAMVNVQRRIDRDHLPLKMLLQIHDELVLETPTDLAHAHAEIVCAEMEQAMRLRIPLRAEAGIGPNWLEAH